MRLIEQENIRLLEKRFAKLRKDKKFSSQKKLADKLSFPASTIKNLEWTRPGAKEPKSVQFALLLSLSALYKVSIDYLVTGNEFNQIVDFPSHAERELTTKNHKLNEKAVELFTENRCLKKENKRLASQIDIMLMPPKKKSYG